MPLINELTASAKLENLKLVRKFINDNLPVAYTPLTMSIQCVAEELLVNVCNYSYENQRISDPKFVGEFKISLATLEHEGQEQLLFSIRHWGSNYNPFVESPTPNLTLDLDERPIGGLGVFLVKELSQRQEYKYENKSASLDIYFDKAGTH